MRKRLLTSALAAVLTVGISAGTAVQPAAAAPAVRQDQIGTLAVDPVGIFVSLASSFLSSGGVSSGELQAAVRQIMAAIDQVRTDIMNHIDLIAEADVRACVRSHVIEFSDIEFFSTNTLQRWAQDVTSCAARATAYLDAVQSPSSVDHLGFLVDEVYAMAIAARLKAGFVNGIPLLISDQIRSYETVIRKLDPACTRIPVRPTGETRYDCVAYNGDRASAIVEEPSDLELLRDRASRNTSRQVAKAALPQLRTVQP